MITVETRGRKNQTRTFTRAADAKSFVIDAQTSNDCALIKHTENGRSTYFEFNNGAWEIR